MASPSDAARVVADLAAARPPTLGHGRLVCVDGPAGSGKTTLATALAELTGAAVVHMDDLMQGWEAATRTTPQLRGLLEPLGRDQTGTYRRWDWLRHRPSRVVRLAPAPWLVVEGVGSGNPAVAHLATALVWVQVDDDLRLARGLARDGAAMEPHWRRFMRDETEMFAEHRTRDRADVLVDGTSENAPVVRVAPT